MDSGFSSGKRYLLVDDVTVNYLMKASGNISRVFFAIIVAMERHGRVLTNAQIAQVAVLSRRTIQNCTKQLEDDGMLGRATAHHEDGGCIGTRFDVYGVVSK